MIYDREITDSVMIQYIILFTLAKANRIVTHSQLTTLILDNCNINFADLIIALDNLVEIGCVRTFSSDEKKQYVELTAKGTETNGFFQKSIPIYIREPIEKSIAPFFHEEKLRKSVRAELMPINETEYLAELGIYEGNTPLMNLSVYAGTREMAADMIRKFRADPESFYKLIMETLTSSEKPENED